MYGYPQFLKQQTPHPYSKPRIIIACVLSLVVAFATAHMFLHLTTYIWMVNYMHNTHNINLAFTDLIPQPELQIMNSKTKNNFTVNFSGKKHSENNFVLNYVKVQGKC